MRPRGWPPAPRWRSGCGCWRSRPGLGVATRRAATDSETTTDELRLPTGDPATLPSPPSGGDECRWIYVTSWHDRHAQGGAPHRRLGDRLVGGHRHSGTATYPTAWPFTHIGGVTMLASVLRAGGELVLFEAFDPATAGARMAAVRPTIRGAGVPFFRAYIDAQRRHGDDPPRKVAAGARRAPARQKTPEQIEVVGAIECNPMGKVVKTELRRRILVGAGPA